MTYSIFLLISCIIPSIYSLPKFTPADLDELQRIPETNSFLLHKHPYDGGVFISLEYCYHIFGRGYTPYPTSESLQSITGWLVPLFVLVGNMYMPSFSGMLQNILHFLAVTGHLLADPIDTIWSLGCKLQVRRIIYWRLGSVNPGLNQKERRELTTILFTLHDYLDTQPTSDRTVRVLVEAWIHNPEAVGKAAKRLNDMRVKNTRRVVVAIIVYIATVFTAWHRTKDNPPLYYPHRIALRELYYWLLSAIVLSCVAGGFPTDQTAKWVLEDHHLAYILGLRHQELKPWEGGTYSCAVDRTMDARKAWLLLQAFMAVTFSWASAFAMSWISSTPGLECRNILQLCYWMIWTLNCGINWALHCAVVSKNTRLKLWWQLVMVKDFLIGMTMVLVLFAAFKGKSIDK